jgi:hypothetical protein
LISSEPGKLAKWAESLVDIRQNNSNMKKKLISVLLLAVITAGAFAFFSNASRNFDKGDGEKKQTPAQQSSPSLTQDPHQLIEGVWIVEDYTFKTLTEEAKGAHINLEESKKNKTLHYFRNGKAGGDEKVSEVIYDFKDGKIFLWSPKEVDSDKLTDNVMKNPRVQVYTYSFPSNYKMKFSMINENFSVDVIFSKVTN